MNALEEKVAFTDVGSDENQPRASLALPMTVLGKTVGVFELQSYTPDAYRPQHLVGLGLAASLAAVMGEHMQLLERERQQRKAIQASEVRVRLLLESTAEAIYGLDSEGRCTFVNPACVRLLGYDHPNELLGKSMHELCHATYPDGRGYPQEECKIYQAFRLGEKVHVDDEVVWRKDGTAVPVEYWAHPIREGGRVVGTVVTFLDISERKRAERERQGLTRQLEQRVAHLSALHIIDRAISGSVDLAMTLEVVIEQVKQLLGVNAVAVLLYDRERQALGYASGQGFRTSALRHGRLRLGEGMAG